ncbi:hypothetical protein GE061_005492 [Apolygus lucorum]|uniref:Uncharacterized protein n=1 Tax=Apolygus lucorum TaxID=248454 RepID=A0A6A4J4T6_APOLU|nr:hypothetical protein GE061_005492 [Apolygus lucorum]
MNSLNSSRQLSFRTSSNFITHLAYNFPSLPQSFNRVGKVRMRALAFLTASMVALHSDSIFLILGSCKNLGSTVILSAKNMSYNGLLKKIRRATEETAPTNKRGFL